MAKAKITKPPKCPKCGREMCMERAGGLYLLDLWRMGGVPMRLIDADEFEVVTVQGKSDDFVEGRNMY